MVQFNKWDVLRVLQKYKLPRMMVTSQKRWQLGWPWRMRISPFTWTFSSIFLDYRVLTRITKSLFWLTHQSSSVFPTVHPHHLPLELWYMLWGKHGDVLSWPPFKDSLSSCWKCCQWASLNHQPLQEQPMCTTHPGRGMAAWPVDMSGQPWRAIITPDRHVVS